MWNKPSELYSDSRSQPAVDEYGTDTLGPVQRWRGAEQTPSGWGRCVVTIGIFDGVHRGHQQVITQTVRRAQQAGLRSVVVTFDPHPIEVLRPGSHPPMLTSPQRQAELLAELGVDGLCVLPFTVPFSKLSPEQFVQEVLVERLHVATVVAGENFRFGYKAAGDVAILTELGQQLGFTVDVCSLVTAVDAKFSSTYIRKCLAAGDVVAAATALGRPHRLEGVVVKGDGRGVQLGYPTANFEVHQYAAVPADGIYAGWLIRANKTFPAAVSVGSNPTFAGTQRRVEAFVLDFTGDLYGEHVAIDFVARLRDMERFATAGELAAQIAHDVQRTREILTS